MQDLIERILQCAVRLAEAQCRDATPLPTMLVLDGWQGEAVLRLSFATAGERARLAAKARLMATALQAQACACIFESRILAPGRSGIPVVVAIAGPCGGSAGAVAIFVRNREPADAEAARNRARRPED